MEMNNLIRLTKVNVEYMHGSRFGNTLLEAELFPLFEKKNGCFNSNFKNDQGVSPQAL